MYTPQCIDRYMLCDLESVRVNQFPAGWGFFSIEGGLAAFFFSLSYFWIGLKITVQWLQGEILLPPCLEQRFSDAVVWKCCHQEQYFWKSHRCVRGHLPENTLRYFHPLSF